MAGTQAGNGDKVTLALLGQKIDNLAAEQREVLAALKEQGKDMHRIDNEQCVQAEKVDKLEKEVEKLRNVNAIWSGANTILATLAGIFGLRS